MQILSALDMIVRQVLMEQACVLRWSGTILLGAFFVSHCGINGKTSHAGMMALYI
jgi:hypothetical protein